MAALDRSDQWHRACVDAWPRLVDHCITTEAVVTEASHLVLRGGASAGLPLEFLLAAHIPILGLEVDLHRQAAFLMPRYADLPMDYADATLVVLVQALQVGTVFTTDRKGFAVYRGARNRQFDVVPA